jgi:hypothetical protein
MKIYAFMLLIVSSLACKAQYNAIRFTIQPGFGFTMPLQKIQNGNITDNLISNKATPSYYFTLSANYFLNHWGFGGTITLNQGTNPENFVRNVRTYYAENYYAYIYDDDHGYTLSVNKLMTGPCYKTEKGRLVFIGKLQFGIAQFSTWNNSALLKEKNSNTVIEMTWNHNRSDDNRNFFCFNPSFSIGYRASQRLLLSFDVNHIISIGNFSYTETARNIYTNQITTKHYQYNKTINEISLGISLALILTSYK